jgi:hypothetical protein
MVKLVERDLARRAGPHRQGRLPQQRLSAEIPYGFVSVVAVAFVVVLSSAVDAVGGFTMIVFSDLAGGLTMVVFFPITSTEGGDAIQLKGCGHSPVPPGCASCGTTGVACAGSEARAGAMTLQKAFGVRELGKVNRWGETLPGRIRFDLWP